MKKMYFSCLAALLAASSALAADGATIFTPLQQLAENNPVIEVNRGVIRGGGVIACRVLENEGSITLCDLPSIIKARVTNRGQLEILHDQAVFTEDFHNHGTLKTTDTVVRFEGIYEEDGAYISDPSDNHFSQDFIVGDNGYVVGGLGDNFYMRADLISSSTQNESWNTVLSLLEFRDGFRDGSYDPDHDFYITGDDYGAQTGGYTDNFAWGILNIAANNTLRLVDGNTDAGGGLYVGDITGLVISGYDITNISSPDGINIYYRQESAANSYLDGETYDLENDGLLIPVWPKSPDIDHDGDVDGADLALLAADMNSSCPAYGSCAGDINDNGQVDEADMQIFASAFGGVI